MDRQRERDSRASCMHACAPARPRELGYSRVHRGCLSRLLSRCHSLSLSLCLLYASVYGYNLRRVGRLQAERRYMRRVRRPRFPSYDSLRNGFALPRRTRAYVYVSYVHRESARERFVYAVAHTISTILQQARARQRSAFNDSAPVRSGQSIGRAG